VRSSDGHLRPRLDLEDPRGLRALDRPVDLRVVVGDPRQVDALVAPGADELHAALGRRQHPEPEQVDLQEARVRAGVLVPHDHLPALHRGGHHGAAVHERAGGDDHAARVLGQVARQAVGLLGQARQPAPAPALLPARAEGAADVLVDVEGAEALRRARHPLDLPGRQAERLAELADGALGPEGRERGDERGAVAPVALVDARDQDLAHVAREVQVDVRQRGDLVVEEPPEEQLVLDGIHVREPREVADDRRHARAAPAPRRQQRPCGARAAHLDGDLAGQLEQVAVQDEEPRQPEVRDEAQLLLQPRGGLVAQPVAGRGSASRRSRGTCRPAPRRPRRPPRRGSGTRGRA
jgi:hypothetical protein